MIAIKKICKIISMLWVHNKIKNILKAKNVLCEFKTKTTLIFLELIIFLRNQINKNNSRINMKKIINIKYKMMKIMQFLRKKS